MKGVKTMEEKLFNMALRLEKLDKALEIIKPFMELETINDNGYQLFFIRIGNFGEVIEISQNNMIY